VGWRWEGGVGERERVELIEVGGGVSEK